MLYGVADGQPGAVPSTVTLVAPVITFPLGLFVSRLAVMPATPQFVFGVTLPVLVT
jgi:hypothetical protein